jgi:hypothetical protein
MSSSVSIVIPNFNHGRYLPGVVESCCAIDGGADEVIVVDDQSTDDSRAILGRLQTQWPRLRVIVHGVNRGPAAALNTGLASATSDWILFRAADDRCPPGGLEAFRRAAARAGGAALITGDLVYFDDGGLGAREPMGIAREPVCVSRSTYLDAFGGNIIHGASTFVRRSRATEVGGFDPCLRWHCDWFLLMRLGLGCGFVYAPVPLGAMRLNDESYSSRGTGDAAARGEVLDRQLARLDAEPELLDAMLVVGCLDFFGEPLRERIAAGPPARRQRYEALLQPPAPAIRRARRDTGVGAVLRAFLARAGGRLRAHDGEIAVCGAGCHTAQLLAIWDELRLPRPAVILDPSAAAAAPIAGVPVRPFRELDAASRPLVVLSSKSYEPLFVRMMEERFPRVPFLKVWGSGGVDVG